MFNNLRQDKVLYREKWYRRSGFWITVIYRFGVWSDRLPLPLRIPMWTCYLFLKVLSGIFNSNVFLWAGKEGVRIGPGICLAHATNVMIARGSVIGERCTIYHDVTLGTGQVPGSPTLGDRVVIYPGARVLGGVTVGKDSLVGSNCVVTRDVPPNSTMLAAPGRVIPNSLSTLARRWDQDKKTLPSLREESFALLDEAVTNDSDSPGDGLVAH